MWKRGLDADIENRILVREKDIYTRAIDKQ